MSHDTEWQEARDLERWRAQQRLVRDLVAWVRARASRCLHCHRLAMWRWSDRRFGGYPRDELLCDAHKKDGATEIAGADVLRRIK